MEEQALFEKIRTSIAAGDGDQAPELAERSMERGINPLDLIEKAYTPAPVDVGSRFPAHRRGQILTLKLDQFKGGRSLLLTERGEVALEARSRHLVLRGLSGKHREHPALVISLNHQGFSRKYHSLITEIGSRAPRPFPF